jgi:hypothetical protein
MNEFDETVPDIRVISVIHDNESDSLRISYDEDYISPFEAIGILAVAMLREMTILSIETDELLDGEDDE